MNTTEFVAKSIMMIGWPYLQLVYFMVSCHQPLVPKILNRFTLVAHAYTRGKRNLSSNNSRENSSLQRDICLNLFGKMAKYAQKVALLRR